MKKKRLIALLLCAVLTTGISSFGTQNFAMAEEAQQAEQTAVQMALPDFSTASPWVYSCVTGTLLPEDQQSVKDDFYQAVNYSWLSDNQDTAVTNASMVLSSGSLDERILNYLADPENDSELTQNMSILYSQAADADTQLALDLEPVQKYLDMIDSASSIEELNAVFTSEDYPFDAFIKTSISNHYMDGNNIIRIDPHFFAVADDEGAASYRNYPIDFSTAEGLTLLNNTAEALVAFLKLGYNAAEDSAIYLQLVQFESYYGKDAPYTSETARADYGEIAPLYNYVTLDEIQSHAGNFPVAGILAKEGRDSSELYLVMDIEWLDSLAEVYTDENIDIIKLIAKLQLLKEVKSYTSLAYIDTGVAASTGDISALKTSDADKQNVGYTAIGNARTYGQAIGSIFKDEIMTQDDYDRLYNLSNDLLEQYREVVSQEDWLSDDSKEAIMLKLDNMTLNIFGPACGYIDYDGVQLKTNEEGGNAVENYIILKKYVMEKMNELINTPAVTMSVWDMYSPTTVNAFYDPETNSINICPGIMNDLSYRSDMTDEELYGAIGSILAHEISHAFDYSGSQYNYLGKTESVMTEDDIDAFLERQQKLMDYYSSITLAEDVPVDGKTVITEACADLSGLQMLHRLAAAKDDFDYDTFYKTYAGMYAQTLIPYYAYLIMTDTHPANYLRVNINLQMFDEFYETYDIREGDGMYLDEDSRVAIW